MDFSLSSSLVGSAVSNPDKLALDLQFAADKTLTARKGPTPAFTRGSAGRFVGSDGLIQTAGNGIARFDHDPITFACKGLLMEESRTNLVLQSEDFSTTWQVNAASISNNVTVAPNGLTTADLLNDIATNAAHQVIQSVGSLTAGQSYTFSVFAKAATHASFQMTFSTAAFGSGLFANFVLTGSGSIGTSSGVVSKIESYLNGWYRCSITVVSATGGTGGFVQIAANNNNSSAARLVPYLGTNTQVVNLWGGQLEAGAFPTSYIPTTTASVIRGADVCSISGSAFTSIWNGVDITVLFKGVRQAATSGNYWAMSSGTQATAVQSDRGSTTERLAVAATGIISFTGLGANQSIRTAYAVKQGDFAGSLNGSAIVASTNAHSPSFISFYIGASYTGSIIGAGWVSEMKTFRKRLPNAKLQALTV
jgi:hypothetical protein